MIDRLRRELSEVLGFAVPDATWDYLEDHGCVDKVRNGEWEPAQLYYEVIDVYDAAGRRIPENTTPEHRRPPAMRGITRRDEEAASRAARLDAISVLLSNDARAWQGLVKGFREEAMGGKLLSLEEVEEWIQRKAQEDGAPGRPAEFLAFARPGDRWTSSIPVAAKGVLGQLRALSEVLAERYGWQESQATLFILTDITPLVIDLSVRVSFKNPFTSVSRIVLTIDPALSPREIAEAYRKVRQAVVGSRFRDLSEKHTRLALFASERPEGETWKQQLIAWNEAHPEWAYMAETNFARDCTQAQRRLVTPSFEIPIAGIGGKGGIKNEQAR